MYFTALYKNQKKGLPVIGNFDMNSFKEDVITLESLTGGDVHIFENLEKRQEEIKAIVQGFTSTNTKKSKKKEVSRKSLSVPQPPKTAPAPKTTPKSTPKTTPKSTPKTTSKTTPKTSNKSKPLDSSSRTYYSRIRLTTVKSDYSCHFQVGCKFTTNRYDNLKRHIANHKNNTDVVTTDRPSTSSTSNKRKNVKTNPSEIKKQKLQEELLKDWENDGDDEDELNASDVPMSSSVLQTSNEEVENTTSEVQLSINVVQSSNEVLQTTSEVQLSSNVVQSPNQEVVQTTSEVIPTSNVVSIENDVIPTINKVQETITSPADRVFDFNENDNNTPVVELRQGNSNCNSTADDGKSETFESQLTSDVISNTISGASPTESILAVKTTEDSSDKPHEIHSNELANEIDDQTKSTELLLEKTVNTLDQINNFENSLSCISSGINESDANILTEDNNVVIDVSELCDEHPKEPISINNDIHLETNGIDIPLIENMSIETEDHAIIEENTNDKKIVSNDLEVNQSNGTINDKNIPIENLDSVDSTSNNINSEDVIKKKIDFIDGIPNPEWSKEEIWESFAQNGVAEGNN